MTQTTSVQDDRELLARAQAGDMSAFEALVEPARDKVFGLALRMTRSRGGRGGDHPGHLPVRLPAPRGVPGRGRLRLLGAPHRGQQRPDAAAPPKVVDRRSSDELAGPGVHRAGLPGGVPRVGLEHATPRRRPWTPSWGGPSSGDRCAPRGLPGGVPLEGRGGASVTNRSAEMAGDSIPAMKSRLHRARLALREAIDAFYNTKCETPGPASSSSALGLTPAERMYQLQGFHRPPAALPRR